MIPMEKRILDIVRSPDDLKLLTNEELSILAQEIREEIVQVTSQTGGHVASSLGAVEIILAAHAVLNSPHDKIVYDVGHQSYAHKLVTGRNNRFYSLRTYDGVSGFPKPSESAHDVYPSGHASDSLSVALGLAKARDLNESDERIVAVIGDASLSGGMAFEALNQIGQDQTPMVIILNDNEMSISRNVGALMKHLGNMRASAQYRNKRDTLQEFMESKGRLGQRLADLGRNMKDSLKQLTIPQSVLFEQLGIICTAPIDGHNIALLKETLSVALAAGAPVMMHVVTKKGMGYGPAECHPERFHGIGPYDIATGEAHKKTSPSLSYTEVFSQTILREASEDKDIVAITAAMKNGTGLDAFSQSYPDRFIDAGIAEEHAVGLASGLAKGGKKPVVAVYSTFAQRAFDQIIINNALCSLDVVFCLDRAGLVGEDGPTHHGIFDIAYTRMIPNMSVLAPSNEAELVNALHTALKTRGPFAIRYPRGTGEGVAIPEVPEVLKRGKAKVLRKGKDVSILAFGRMVHYAQEAASLLAEEGIEARVVDMRWVKPLDNIAIAKAAHAPLVVTVEEGVVSGGIGEEVLREIALLDEAPKTLNLGIPDAFVMQGEIDLLLHDLKLDAIGIKKTIKRALEE